MALQGSTDPTLAPLLDAELDDDPDIPFADEERSGCPRVEMPSLPIPFSRRRPSRTPRRRWLWLVMDGPSARVPPCDADPEVEKNATAPSHAIYEGFVLALVAAYVGIIVIDGGRRANNSDE